MRCAARGDRHADAMGKSPDPPRPRAWSPTPETTP